MPRPFVHDTWSALSFKQAIGDGNSPRGVAAGAVLSWVPDEDARRLAAYRILAAYRDNVSRYYLPDAAPDESLQKYREYGHAALLIAQTRAALLGDEQSITVDGLADDDTEQPTEDQNRAALALDWLTGWAERERLLLRLLNGEEDALTLGDSVYALGWDPVKGRPRLRLYDPGFYFPELTDGDPDEYPRTVHMAWEEQDRDGKHWLHRLTWRLAPIGSVDGVPVARTYAWSDKASPETCYFTHAVWSLDKVRDRLYDLGDDAARYEVDATGRELRDVDLAVDFLPVVHVPCDSAGARHFGRSLLLSVSQVLDDLAATDTDLQVSSELVGSATLVTKGMPLAVPPPPQIPGALPNDMPAGPGKRMDLPTDGAANYLDTSRNLDALLKYDRHLTDTMSINSRVPAVALGRVDASQVPSGIALALSFSPLENLIREMRLVRHEKLGLLLRMALRMAQANGLVPRGATPVARIAFGSFMPTDQAEAAKNVRELLTAKAISRGTAVRMLVEAGFPIEDAVEEVTSIQGEDFAGAVQLFEATGDEAAVLDYLGRGAPTSTEGGGAGG